MPGYAFMLARTGFVNGGLVHAFINFVLCIYVAAVMGYQPYLFLFNALFKWLLKRVYVPEALEPQEKVGGAKGL